MNPDQPVFIPENAPFTAEQRAWLNGFFAGLFAAPLATQAQPAPAAPKPSLLVLFGSQTGSAEQLAKKISRSAESQGFAGRVLSMADFAKIDFATEQRLVVVTSTWGDGEPPDNAAGFWSHLNSPAAPKLDHVSFSVLALGDSSYAEFCGAGKKFDARFEQLGAKRFHPRVDCDKDYDSAANGWIESLWPALKSITAATTADSPTITAPSVPTAPAPASHSDSSYSRTNPFPARLVVNRKLNEGSKETRHFEISLEGSNLVYETGDALGVVPSNCPDLVSSIVERLGCDGEEEVTTVDGAQTSLRAALQRDYEIHKIPSSLLQAAFQQNDDLRVLLQVENKAKLDDYVRGRDVLDVLTDYAIQLPPKEFVASLRKLPHRFYSIASSLKAHPGEVHLTIAVVRWDSHGRGRKGVCSTFLAERISEKTTVPIFAHSAPHFRLPKKSETPVIMVGPGTGIAPFRAFLEERMVTAEGSRNWLFFGHQHAATDFFYRDELLAMQKKGVLTRLETAFSRDQNEKIYVQHRLLENAKEVWTWLQEGAHFYVCGDASRMAKDVDAALHEIAEKTGGLSKDNAASFIQDLKTNKRYQRDVY